jgi:hypothetical protein
MAVYRFRVTFEDNDEVYRDIDIKSTQTFLDFHKAILASIEFEDNCYSSFFISDDMWRRGDEVALVMPNEEDLKKRGRKAEVPKYLMEKCKMALLIDDPHQKFIYIHDPEKLWTFTVELIKILPDDAKIAYPKCSKSFGVAPKKVKVILPLSDELLDEELDEVDNLHDDEAYAHASEDIELDDLDEEENKEEAAEEDDVLEDEDDDFKPSYGDGEEGEDSF